MFVGENGKGMCGCVVYAWEWLFPPKSHPLDYNKRKENKNKLYQHMFLLVYIKI